MNDPSKDYNADPPDAHLERRLVRLTALYDITSALNSVIDRDELLRLILQKTKELLEVEGASIIFWDKSEKMLYFPLVAVEEREIEDQLRHLRFSADSGIAGWVFRMGRPAVVQDVNKDDRFYRDIDESTEYKTKSILCVPLKNKDETFGVLEAVNKKDGGFTRDDQDLLIAMADNIAISIEKANLYYGLQKAEALLRRQNAELKRSVRQKYSFENIIGKSDILLDVLKKAEQVSLTDASVLIYGETGTGKELIAQAIHNKGPRASKNFVAINCGAIPENLLESELFGHERGAFTNATIRRIGRFEEANNGTLFLDEIGDMPLNLQVKLLRVLQEGIIQRLGSNQEIVVDVRLISATYQDLEKLVKEGRFRQDLYYRLKVFEIEIPPLRKRTRDFPLLIDHFIKTYNTKFGKQIRGIENNAINILYNYEFPGNIRELENIIERAIILSKKDKIAVEDLPPEICSIKPSTPIEGEVETFVYIPHNNEELKAAKAEARKKAEERVERIFLKDLLSKTKGNVSEGARQANMNRSWLAQLVSKYDLDLKKFRKGSD